MEAMNSSPTMARFLKWCLRWTCILLIVAVIYSTFLFYPCSIFAQVLMWGIFIQIFYSGIGTIGECDNILTKLIVSAAALVTLLIIFLVFLFLPCSGLASFIIWLYLILAAIIFPAVFIVMPAASFIKRKINEWLG